VWFGTGAVGEQFDGKQEGDWWPAGDQDWLPAQGWGGGDVGRQGHHDPQPERQPQREPAAPGGVRAGAEQADAGQQHQPIHR